MREASSEFDSVMALTSETVTRGVSLLPQRRLPRAAPSSISQSVANLIFSCTLSTGPNWVTFTKVYNSLVSLLVLSQTRGTNFNINVQKCSTSVNKNSQFCQSIIHVDGGKKKFGNN